MIRFLVKYILILLLILCGFQLYADWERGNGPNGGGFINIYGRDSIMVATVNYEHVYISYDNANNWNLLKTFHWSDNINCVGIHNDIIFVGGDDCMYVSYDLGFTWHSSYSGLPSNNWITEFELFNDTVFIGTKFGVYKFINIPFGSYWKKAHYGIIEKRIECLHNHKDSLLIASTDAGIFFSDNYGASWEPPASQFNTTVLNITSNDSLIFVFNGNIYCTNDYGLSWEKKMNGISNCQEGVLEFNRNDIFAGSSDGVYISQDFGDNWELLDDQPIIPDYMSFSYSHNNHLYIGIQWAGGLYYLDDFNLKWIFACNGINYVNADEICVLDTGIYTVCFNTGVQFSKDQGESWCLLNEGIEEFDNMCNMSISGFDRNLFLGSNKKIYKSENNGLSWSSDNSGLVNENICFSDIWVSDSLILCAAYTDVSYLDPNGRVYKSIDNGENWIDITPSPNELMYSIINTPKGIYVGTSDDQQIHYVNIYHSDDLGNSWQIELNSYYFTKRINSFTYNDTAVFAATETGVLINSNFAGDWISMNNGLHYDESITDVLFVDNCMFSCSYDGIVYLYNNTDKSWIDVSEGLDFLYSPDPVLSSDGENLYLAGFTELWKRPINEIVTQINSGLKSSDSYNLFPNPNSGCFRISEINNSKDKSYIILNGDGKFLLEKNFISNGLVDISFLKSGIYYIRFESGGKQCIKKIVKYSK